MPTEQELLAEFNAAHQSDDALMAEFNAAHASPEQGLGAYLAGQGVQGVKESVVGPYDLLKASADSYNTQSPFMQTMPEMVRAPAAVLNTIAGSGPWNQQVENVADFAGKGAGATLGAIGGSILGLPGTVVGSGVGMKGWDYAKKGVQTAADWITEKLTGQPVANPVDWGSGRQDLGDMVRGAGNALLPVAAGKTSAALKKTTDTELYNLSKENVGIDQTANLKSGKQEYGFKGPNKQVTTSLDDAKTLIESTEGPLKGETPSHQLADLNGRIASLESQIDPILATTDANLAATGQTAKVDLANAREYIKSIPKKNLAERARAQKILDDAEATYATDLDGSVRALQDEKVRLYKDIGSRAYQREAGTADPLIEGMDKAIASDLKQSIENYAGKDIADLNTKLGAYYELEPGLLKTAFKSTKSRTGEVANAPIGAITKMGVQAAGPRAVKGINAVSGLGSLLSPPPVAGAMTAAASTPPSPMAPADPFANGLPRDTNQWNMMAVNRFAKYALGKPPEIAGIAQGLVQKFATALHQEDKGKLQRIIADMAKLFPDAFEPGMGIDNKIFHPDDQGEYLDQLLNGVRKGLVEPSFLARQREAFLNKNDSAIIPIEKHVQQQVMGGLMNKPPVGNQPRQYPY